MAYDKYFVPNDTLNPRLYNSRKECLSMYIKKGVIN